MGHSWIDVEIFNLERTNSQKIKALVDTGATLTVFILESLGFAVDPTTGELKSTPLLLY